MVLPLQFGAEVSVCSPVYSSLVVVFAKIIYNVRKSKIYISRVGLTTKVI